MATQEIKTFMGQPESVPYASLDTLKSYSKEDIKEFNAKFGEATFDEVVQLTIIREKIYQESALLSVGSNVVVTRQLDRLESQIFAPTEDAVQHTYPLPPENVAPSARAKPVTYNVQSVSLELGETRYFITDEAKLRGAADWLMRDSAKRAAEHIAASKDKHILENIDLLDPAGNSVAAAAPWDSASSNPELDLSKAIDNIITNSNISNAQINASNTFGLVIPAAAFTGVTRLKLIRNIQQPVRDFLQTEYKVKIFLSRKPTTESSWAVEKDAFVVPLNDSDIGFLGTWDGGGIVPAQERNRVAGRGEDIITKQWYKWTSIPYPFSGSTNAKIAKITGVLT
jgi:hypothetical protein